MEDYGSDRTRNSGQFPGQTQMRREDMFNETSDMSNQGHNSNFLQETGAQVKHMAQGGADVGMGAAQAALNLARGAAVGAANVAQGTGEAIKNTLGMNDRDTTNKNMDFGGTTGGNMDFGRTTATGGGHGTTNKLMDFDAEAGMGFSNTATGTGGGRRDTTDTGMDFGGPTTGGDGRTTNTGMDFGGGRGSSNAGMDYGDTTSYNDFSGTGAPMGDSTYNTNKNYDRNPNTRI